MTLTTFVTPAIVDSDVIKILAWPDRHIDAFGHDPRSSYVEQFWLGTLGPSTTWFLRHCAHLLEGSEAASVNLHDAATTLGIRHGGGIRSAMGRTVARACRFRAARPVGSSTLAVRTKLPRVSRTQLERLPRPVQQLHAEYVSTEPVDHVTAEHRRRARRLALSLIECGDEQDEAELHLARLQFHPALAAEAVRWAWQQRRVPVAPVPPDAA